MSFLCGAVNDFCVCDYSQRFFVVSRCRVRFQLYCLNEMTYTFLIVKT